MREAQRLAATIVRRTLAGRSLDAELARLAREHPDARVRAAVQDLSYGTLRFLGRLEVLLDPLLDKPLRDEALRALLRVALYQLEYTSAAPHAVVDQAVSASSALGFASARGLVNAVLRAFLRRREELAAQAERSEVGRFSFPQWWIDKLRQQYPEHYAAILGTANLHPPLTLRVNVRRAAVPEYLAQLERRGIAARALGEFGVVLERPQPVEHIPGFAEGCVSVQDAGAQYAARFLDLHTGQRVLDAFAAPGGKTAHVLELADVALTALDNNPTRLERLHATLQRLGLNAHVVCGDARSARQWWDARAFDRILADVPCSASGVVRRHPDIKWLRRPGDIAQFAREQASLLDALWQLLASGGKLLYATCSVFHEENHLQVEQFLERHRDADRLILPPADMNPTLPVGQILPDERHDGFFYALLQKK